jgi:hypothetical protein
MKFLKFAFFKATPLVETRPRAWGIDVKEL